MLLTLAPRLSVIMSTSLVSRRLLRRKLSLRRTAFLSFALGLTGAGLLPQQALAQEAGEGSAVDQQSEQTQGGLLRLIVFIETEPGTEATVSFRGARVSVAGVQAQTDDNGVADLDDVAPGVHTVQLKFASGKQLSVDGVGFASGETTQVLLTVDGAGTELNRDVEAPELDDPALLAEEPEVKEAKLPGKIVGKATDAETGEPIRGVQIYIRGVDQPVQSDAQGRFEISVLEGTHDLSALHGKYASESREEIEVAPKGTTEIELKMNPSSAELEDLVIVEPYVQGGVSSGVAEEKDSTAVQDVIGAEQMSKSGDSDASSALSRVTGLTVVGGKFVYVRGMGERYSSTLLNGAQVPSPEPERRVVPLDLFPTAVLESVVVQKTYSPDMPAEFGGGVIQLRTRSYPEEFLFKVGGSLGANTETTFQQGPTYNGGSLDWLGIDDGGRDRSDVLAAESTRGEPLILGNRFNPGLTQEEVNEFGASLPNTWNTRQRALMPDGKLTATLGDTFELGGVSVGYVAAAQYSNEWQNTDEIRRSVQTSDEGVLVATDYELERATNTIGLTGMGAIGVKFMEGQELFSNTMVLRSSDNTTLLGEGRGLEGGERFARLRFVERQLFTQQFRGVHVFQPLSDLQLDWRFVYSVADRSEPDRKDYRYDFLPDQQNYFMSVRGGAMQRFYSENDDVIVEGGGDLMLPISWTEELVTKLKAGTMILNRTREVTTYRYQYRIDQFAPVDARNELRQQDVETILDSDNILQEDGIQFAETTGEDEPYDASQDLYAGYGMVETPVFVENLNLMGGLRYEASRQQVETTNASADLDTGDWLPAGTLTWAFIEDMQIRAGFSRTVSRPDFRELSLARFFDVEASTEIVGNPNLTRATINHYDLRWEWYFSGDESLTVAGFFKQFDDPIETVVLAGTSRRQSWQNADSATNVGVEIEGRKRLGFLADFLDSFFIASNLSLISSAVELGDGDAGETVNTSQERSLEGQSPYVLNVQFGYDDLIGQDGNLSVTALFNVAGRRIIGVGANGAPDIYEEPFPKLDFVTRHKVDDHWTWGFKAQNLLNPVRLATQGSVEVIRLRRGMDFSLAATYTY